MLKTLTLASGLLVFLCASAAIVRLNCPLPLSDAAVRQHRELSLRTWSGCFPMPMFARDCWAAHLPPRRQERGHRKALLLDAAFVLPDATTALFIPDSKKSFSH
eukprot:jgi/Botrbrau1/12955/Bobra.154_2s0015.1